MVSTQVELDHFPRCERYGRKRTIFQILKRNNGFLELQPMNPAPVAYVETVKNSTRWKLDLAWFCHLASTRTGQNISATGWLAIQFPAGILKKFTILSYHVQPVPQQVLMVFLIWLPNWFRDFAGEQASLKLPGVVQELFAAPFYLY